MSAETIALEKETRALRERVAKLERTVAFLLEELKLNYVDKPDGPNPDILELVRQGKRLDAVKRYRELTGASLTDATDYINSL